MNLRLLLLFILIGCNPKQNNDSKQMAFGGQTWSILKLNVDTFQNGDKIIQAKSPQEWVELNFKKIPSYCYYNFDSSHHFFQGKYYNGHAILDERKLAPKGWKIPSITDWSILEKFFLGRIGNDKNLSDSSLMVNRFNNPPTGYCSSKGFFYCKDTLTVYGTSNSVKPNQVTFIMFSKFTNESTSRTLSKNNGIVIQCIKE